MTGRRRKAKVEFFDRELNELPQALRWREWMGRVEAVIFAAATPVSRAAISVVVGADCAIEALIDDLREEFRGRAFDLVKVAGGWQFRTRSRFADVIRLSGLAPEGARDLSEREGQVLMAIAYFQPITRGELGRIFGREISRDTIGALRGADMIAAGPRSPEPGAPYTYVTTSAFLSRFGFDTLRDLPDMEKLEDAGLLGKEALLAEGMEALDSALLCEGDSDAAEGEDEDFAEEI